MGRLREFPALEMSFLLRKNSQIRCESRIGGMELLLNDLRVHLCSETKVSPTTTWWTSRIEDKDLCATTTQ